MAQTTLPASAIEQVADLAGVPNGRRLGFAIAVRSAVEASWRTDIKELRYHTLRPLFDELIAGAAALQSALARAQELSIEASIVRAVLSAALAQTPSKDTELLPLLALEQDIRRMLAKLDRNSSEASILRELLIAATEIMLQHRSILLPLDNFERQIGSFIAAARAANGAAKRRFPARGAPKGVKARGIGERARCRIGIQRIRDVA